MLDVLLVKGEPVGDGQFGASGLGDVQRADHAGPDIASSGQEPPIDLREVIGTALWRGKHIRGKSYRADKRHIPPKDIPEHRQLVKFQ